METGQDIAQTELEQCQKMCLVYKKLKSWSEFPTLTEHVVDHFRDVCTSLHQQKAMLYSYISSETYFMTYELLITNGISMHLQVAD